MSDSPAPNLTIDFKSPPQSIKDSFRKIAEELFNHWVLQAGSREFRLAEIEFYLKTISRVHPDESCHSAPQQLRSHEFYFHDSGMDITFGNQDFYGGILIRSLQDLQGNGGKEGYIHGPLISMGYLLDQGENVFEKAYTLKMVNSSKLPSEAVYSGPRVGLSKYPKQWQTPHYRFYIFPQKEHKDKTKLAEALHKQGIDKSEINEKIFGWKVL